MHLDNTNALRLKTVIGGVEVDALIRVLQVFQQRNVNPRKVTAERIFLRSQDREVLHVEVEFAVSDLTMDALRFIAANIAQMPITLSTVFGHPREDFDPLNHRTDLTKSSRAWIDAARLVFVVWLTRVRAVFAAVAQQRELTE